LDDLIVGADQQLDEDGEVSFSDFSVFANCMLGPGIAHQDGCEYADLNADGDADLGDYSEFQRLYSAAQQ
jgi:hypothetical protein